MEKKYQMPNLKDARLRTDNPVDIKENLFKIPKAVENIGFGKNFYLRTYGCQANERDGEVMLGIFKQLGYTQVFDTEEADVILLNTCAIREGAEDKVFGELGSLKRLKRENPDLILGLCGCMAQEEYVVNRILEKYQHVDLVFGTHNIHRLPQLLGQAIFSKEKVIEVFSEEGHVIENLPSSRVGHHKAWVNIIYGCDKFCSYCIVPYTRGKERSRMMSDVLNEIDEVIEAGYKEVTLLGQNVNAYGKDLEDGTSFAKLLQAVADKNIARIRFTTSHPWDFSEEMIEVIASNSNVMPSFHLPVQSGNDKILRMMGRRYTVDSYKEIYNKLKTRIPNCSFTTDIIVGFPNETQAQFQETLDLYEYCKFDLAYTFVYSPRKGTPAAKFEDNISDEVKSQRLQELNLLVGKYAQENNAKYLNKVVKVLVDGPSKRNKDIYSGYSETNKLVNFTPMKAKVGDIVKVLITETKSYSLNGIEKED
ncbi:MAG: tRNA (N6-isopentenyl adenosine(37)-C2)-methylthiotransferase MiaB [Erysipelothrix sp.]|nr:tRNA (N6-isopentenyl adenosine(37)-C2)-methylthiotransferase MiaB [Erysipelothrix sp.]